MGLQGFAERVSRRSSVDFVAKGFMELAKITSMLYAAS